jgi:hypothetical protein
MLASKFMKSNALTYITSAQRQLNHLLHNVPRGYVEL